jgi:tellurite resistance protein
MKTSNHSNARALIPPLLLAFSCVTVAAAAAGVSDIELRRLFEPTTSERAAEAKGEIYIYEGLRDIDVQRAMDEQFGRVENMMFIRTIKTDETGKTARDPETGAAVTSDDGC